ncbi:MAG: hypothetical protein J7J54_00070 [Candidatus Omnitrophica bacterium]|nr:hypothetical protein [Candidatus Omnitrophota bacterium]
MIVIRYKFPFVAVLSLVILASSFAYARRIKDIEVIESYLHRIKPRLRESLSFQEEEKVRKELERFFYLCSQRGIEETKFILDKLSTISQGSIEQWRENIKIFEQFINNFPITWRNNSINKVAKIIFNELPRIQPSSPSEVEKGLDKLKELAVTLDRFGMDMKILPKLSSWAVEFSKARGRYTVEEYIKNLICFNEIILASKCELKGTFGERVLELLISMDEDIELPIIRIIEDCVYLARKDTESTSQPNQFRNHLRCYLLTSLFFMKDMKIGYEETDVKEAYPVIISYLQNWSSITEDTFFHLLAHMSHITTKLYLAGVRDVTILGKILEIIKNLSKNNASIFIKVSHDIQAFIESLSDLILKDYPERLSYLIDVAYDVSRGDRDEFIKNLWAIYYFLQTVKMKYKENYEKIDKYLQELERIKKVALHTQNPASTFRSIVKKREGLIKQWGGILE